MSYCKIVIGGKERGLKFNQMAQLILQEKLDPQHIVSSSSYALIYAGLRANAYVKSEETDFTFEDVCDWVDKVTAEDIIKVSKAYQETEAYKTGAAYKAEQEALEKANEGKKKLLPKKPRPKVTK